MTVTESHDTTDLALAFDQLPRAAKLNALDDLVTASRRFTETAPCRRWCNQGSLESCLPCRVRAWLQRLGVIE